MKIRISVELDNGKFLTDDNSPDLKTAYKIASHAVNEGFMDTENPRAALFYPAHRIKAIMVRVIEEPKNGD